MNNDHSSRNAINTRPALAAVVAGVAGICVLAGCADSTATTAASGSSIAVAPITSPPANSSTSGIVNKGALQADIDFAGAHAHLSPPPPGAINTAVPEKTAAGKLTGVMTPPGELNAYLASYRNSDYGPIGTDGKSTPEFVNTLVWAFVYNTAQPTVVDNIPAGSTRTGPATIAPGGRCIGAVIMSAADGNYLMQFDTCGK